MKEPIEAATQRGVGEAALVRRMCEIILGNTFGNEELDSLALLVGHHPDVLNAFHVPTEEVAKLVRWLRRSAGCADESQMDLRAAELLEQRHPAPVPVSERLPGPEDCDAEGLCWVWNRTAYTWGLFRLDLTAHSHWLPATALPLPQGEVE